MDIFVIIFLSFLGISRSEVGDATESIQWVFSECGKYLTSCPDFYFGTPEMNLNNSKGIDFQVMGIYELDEKGQEVETSGNPRAITTFFKNWTVVRTYVANSEVYNTSQVVINGTADGICSFPSCENIIIDTRHALVFSGSFPGNNRTVDADHIYQKIEVRDWPFATARNKLQIQVKLSMVNFESPSEIESISRDNEKNFYFYDIYHNASFSFFQFAYVDSVIKNVNITHELSDNKQYMVVNITLPQGAHIVYDPTMTITEIDGYIIPYPVLIGVIIGSSICGGAGVLLLFALLAITLLFENKKENKKITPSTSAESLHQ